MKYGYYVGAFLAYLFFCFIAGFIFGAMSGCATQTDGLLPQQYTAQGVPKVPIKDYTVRATVPPTMTVCRDGNKVWSCK